MSIDPAFIFVAIIAGPLAWLAMRDHRKLRASRMGLLDDCTHLFFRPELTHGGDSFPSLSGYVGPGKVDVRLISDTMTIRRLPQLWLQVTAIERVPDVAGIAVLVRPSGYEFYSLTAGFDHVMDTPPEFPREVLVRGENPRAELTLQKLTQPMAAILADPTVKEIAVTRQGLRIIRQAGEGRKGEYLLLRQAVFDEATVAATDLEATLAEIDTLRDAANTKTQEPTYA
jgi:hypothetical protein